MTEQQKTENVPETESVKNGLAILAKKGLLVPTVEDADTEKIIQAKKREFNIDALFGTFAKSS
jgi:pyruvate/2-oxoglutarate dehydrogenase complex dihydrolipoamide acyltransferase (E2) component